MALVDTLRCNSSKLLPLQCATRSVLGHRDGNGLVGVRSAEGTQPAALWPSWADSLAMMHARHLAVANTNVRALDANVDVPFVRELQRRGHSGGGRLCGAIVGRIGEEPSRSKHGWQRVVELTFCAAHLSVSASSSKPQIVRDNREASGAA